MNIQNFINEKFGSIRVVVEDGTEWFVAKDVAKCLGYKKTRNAIQDHVDNEYKKEALIQGPLGGPQNTIIINEAGVYQLIFSSKLPDAQVFQDWVFEEVLPSIKINRTVSSLYWICKKWR